MTPVMSPKAIFALAVLLCPVWTAPVPLLAATPGLIGPVDDRVPVADDVEAQDMSGGDARDDNWQVQARRSADLPPETPASIRAAVTSDIPVADWEMALALAYWTSPAVLAQRALVKSYDYRLPEARAAYGLQLDYQLMQSWQRDRNDPTALQRELGQATAQTNRGFSNSAMAVLTMPLFTFGRTAAAERSAGAQRAYQAQVLRQTEQTALYDAVTAYAGLIRDRTAVQIARDYLIALDQESLDNQARLQAHEITRTELELVRTRDEEAHAQLYVAQSAAASSEATFLQKIGARADSALTAAMPAPLSLPARTLEDAYAYAENHSPVVLAAHQRELVSRAAVDAARSTLLPRVDFRAQAIYGSQNPYTINPRYTEQIASVVVSGPIFESGLRRTQIADALAANDSDWRLIDATLRDTRAAIAANWNDMVAQQAAAARYASAAITAHRAYDGAMIQERAGQITTFDVLQTALEVLTVRSSANLATANAVADLARIMALIGALEPGAILQGQATYDTDRHFNKVRHSDDLPLITPLTRALDNLALPPARLRPIRDPANAITVPAARLNDPPAPTVPGKIPER